MYQIFVMIYRRAGVEPPSYKQFREFIKKTPIDRMQGRGGHNYADE